MIHSLAVQYFRNLASCEHTFGALTLLTGDNGSGKTSMLEALYYTVYLASFRTAQQEQIIQWNAPYFLLTSETDDCAEQVRLCRFRERDSEIKIGNRLCKNKKQAIAYLSPRRAAAVLSPHVEALVNAEPSRRRQWLDKMMFHMEHDSDALVAQYERALFNRNAALKRKHYKDDAFWLHQLTLAGVALNEKRHACFVRLQNKLTKWLTLVGCEQVSLALYSGWSNEDTLLNQYYKHIPEDRANGFTKIGAHKADIHIYWRNNILAKHASSRGQNKLLNLALLCAELDCLQEYVATRLLLIDDINAELDQKHLQLFCKELLGHIDAQIFVSAIEYNKALDALQRHAQLQSFSVADGCITPA